MVELVVFPDVEAALVAYLKSRLMGVKVSTQVPNPRVAKMVRVEAAGGSGRGLAMSKRLLIVQCWDTKSPDAAALCERVAALVFAAQYDPAVPEIRGVTSVGEPASFPDPDTSLPRYQFSASLDVRGHITQ
ncbi:tail terminator [Gordonia phage Getalong]|uniref:Tail terminator n=1 Tax=Gordonia phage Getalong TaxID=2315531 RepID=A0A386KEX8_9CAUD|nr:head-to-tail connector complex protein [Gordonia phage Getalong]AYD83872.1 tail terminator [Gordonia phage Getalong]UAW08259.1 tail terminator [Gordonia phage Whitney]